MTLIKGRLINVSNRLPVVVKRYAGGPRVERSSGGLASALNSAWQHQPGIWIGWAGTSQNHVDHLLARASRRRSYTLQAVQLSNEEVAKFYSGFANEIIWPLFHDMPSRCNFDPDYWETYQRVNQKFAAAAARTAREDDFVWVHDYHLMLTARCMREQGVRSRLGFFLHIPFPAPDMFEKLPWRQAVLRSLLEFDIIGFQTDRDRSNFASCAQRLIPEVSVGSANPHLVLTHQSHRSIVGTFPISIDFDEFANEAARPEVASRATEIRRELMENILVLGVDRMDYTKGIPERLKSFRILLRRYPELRHQITLVQVVVPSRDELLAYYRAADIALITPLKDGMNLVAKEFCAAQTDERGVLIVSEFAGAGPELRHGAILVNPNDFAGVAQALRDASQMPAEEKRNRMRLLRDIIKDHNVQRWARSFLQAAAALDGASTSGSGGASSESNLKEPPQQTHGVALVAAAFSRRRPHDTTIALRKTGSLQGAD